MLMSGYKQTGSSQMFLQSVFSVRYWGIFCIYMLSALTITAFSSLSFLYTFVAFLLKHSLRYMRNIRPKGMLFPKMFPQIIRVLFPNRICCIDLHQIYNLTDRHCWFCFYHVMDMVFIKAF